MPSGVGSDSENQKDTKKQIDSAIRSSRRAAGQSDDPDADEDWGPGARIGKSRPESILNVAASDPDLLAFSRWLSVNCGGPGSGIPGPCPKNAPHVTARANANAAKHASGKAKARLDAAKAKHKARPTAASAVAVAKAQAAHTAAKENASAKEKEAKAAERKAKPKATPAKAAKAKASVAKTKDGVVKAKKTAPKVKEKKESAPVKMAKAKVSPASKAKAAPAKPKAPKSSMDGHPMAGMSQAEKVQAHLRDGSATTPSANPRGYDLKNYPKGVDGPKLANDVQAFVNDAAAKNSFAVVTIRDAYDAVKEQHSNLSLHDFQGSLAKMQADGAVRLTPFGQSKAMIPDMDAAMPLDRETKFYVRKR